MLFNYFRQLAPLQITSILPSYYNDTYQPQVTVPLTKITVKYTPPTHYVMHNSILITVHPLEKIVIHSK